MSHPVNQDLHRLMEEVEIAEGNYYRAFHRPGDAKEELKAYNIATSELAGYIRDMWIAGYRLVKKEIT